MKGVGGLQGRKQERKIRPLSRAHSCPLSLTPPSTGQHTVRRPLYQRGTKPREGKGPGQGHTAPAQAPSTALPWAQAPAFKPSSVPPFPSPKYATTNRSREARRNKTTLGPLSCLPLKVGGGVASLGWRLWRLFFSISVSVLRLILGARQGSEVTRKAWAHHGRA